MIDAMLSFIAPHYCCGCDKIGGLLCSNCKYNISCEPKTFCVVCCKPTVDKWLCGNCRVPYERAWAVGERNGILQRLIGLYKFERTKSAYRVLGDLLLDTLPDLPPNTVIVPIPTASSHIRERGYDHMLLIAKYIAKARGIECKQALYRTTNTKQRQSTSAQRIAQAKMAFAVRDNINKDRPYLLIDDVMTTGSTIKYASRALRSAGARHLWVAIIARQTLD